MPEVIVVATLHALPGKEAEVEALLRSVIAPTHAEDGCVTYALHRDQKDPTRFAYIERWESRAHLDVHLAAAHLAEFRAKMSTSRPAPRRFSSSTRSQTATPPRAPSEAQSSGRSPAGAILTILGSKRATISTRSDWASMTEWMSL
jgi:quinol monooxygenase YgiN